MSAEGAERHARYIEAHVLFQAAFKFGHKFESCIGMIEAQRRLGFADRARSECVKLLRAHLSVSTQVRKDQFELWGRQTPSERDALVKLKSQLDTECKALFHAEGFQIDQIYPPAEVASIVPPKAPPSELLNELRLGTIADPAKALGFVKLNASFSVDWDADGLKELEELRRKAGMSRKVFSGKGLLTPMEEVPPQWRDPMWCKRVDLPSTVDSVAWAFPMPGLDELISSPVVEGHAGELIKQASAAVCFVLNGGFVFFDSSGKVCSIKPCVTEEEQAGGRHATSSLTFKPRMQLGDTGPERDAANLANRPVTIKALKDCGIHAFTWLGPTSDQTGNYAGSFAYLYDVKGEANPMDCYFRVATWV